MNAPSDLFKVYARTAFHYIVQITDVVENVGGVLTLLWHTNEIANPVNWALYSKILKYLSGKNPWIASVKQVGDWWLK